MDTGKAPATGGKTQDESREGSVHLPPHFAFFTSEEWTQMEKEIASSLREILSLEADSFSKEVETSAFEIMHIVSETLFLAYEIVPEEILSCSPSDNTSFRDGIRIPDSLFYAQAEEGLPFTKNFLRNVADKLARLGLSFPYFEETLGSAPGAFFDSPPGPSCPVHETCLSIRNASFDPLYKIIGTISRNFRLLYRGNDFFDNITTPLWSRQKGFQICSALKGCASVSPELPEALVSEE